LSLVPIQHLHCIFKSVLANSLYSSKPSLELGLIETAMMMFTFVKLQIHVAPTQRLRKAVLIPHWNAFCSNLHHSPSEVLEAKHNSLYINQYKLPYLNKHIKNKHSVLENSSSSIDFVSNL